MFCRIALSLAAVALPKSQLIAAEIFPNETWERKSGNEVGLYCTKLNELARFVGGRGCVVRGGYLVHSWGDVSKSGDIASSVKPVISTLLLMAVQEGKLKSVDEPVARHEPRLKELNKGKDVAITWRHLASQTSGYGLTERPGEAYSYNDYALALYYDTLMVKVYRADGTDVLKIRLAEPMMFEDRFTFNAVGSKDRPGRLAVSVRDMARFGLLYLRGGRWRDKQLIKPELVKLAIDSPLAVDAPLTSGQEAGMLPGQRSLGGSRNITPVGPGYYSFNWWLNRTDGAGRRLYVDAPMDAYVASGHGGKRALWIIPSLDLIVCWNDSPIDDHDQSPGNSESKNNQAALIIKDAVRQSDGQ